MLQKLKPEVNFCACGCEARLVKQQSNGQRKKRQLYTVKCLDDACGNQGQQVPYPWQAILLWNSSDCSEFPEDFSLPFLNLSGLSFGEAQERLVARQKRIEQELKALESNGKKRKADEKLKALRLQLSWIEYGKNWLAFVAGETECDASV